MLLTTISEVSELSKFKYLSKLNNHPSYDEMLNLINFSKKRRK